MSLPERIEKAAESISVDWNPARANEEWAKLQDRKRQMRARRVYAGAGVAMAAAAALVLAVVPFSAEAPSNVAKYFGEVELTDESQVLRLAASSDVEVVRDADEGRELHVHSGSVSFDVAPQRGVFLVRAGAVNIEVLGTEFTVTRDNGQVHVAVQEGRVAVSNRLNEVVLGAGEEVTWSENEPEEEVLEAEDPEAESSEGATARPTRATREPRETWRDLAEAGDYNRAYEQLRRSPAPTRVADLMLAADVTRLSGHAREAVPYLQRVSRRSRDPRAPLASFTLGLLQMEQLGDPQGAARSFARTRRLRQVGPFVEDALAREVEANARAGRRSQARTLAEEYVRRFPEGQRMRAVQRFGGLTP